MLIMVQFKRNLKSFLVIHYMFCKKKVFNCCVLFASLTLIGFLANIIADFTKKILKI